MDKNHRCRVQLKRSLYDDSRMNLRTVDGAVKQLLESKNPMLIIKENRSTECVNGFETFFSKNYCRSFSSSGCPGLCAAGSSGLLIQTALGRG
jgi:hypothetical protein